MRASRFRVCSHDLLVPFPCPLLPGLHLPRPHFVRSRMEASAFNECTRLSNSLTQHRMSARHSHHIYLWCSVYFYYMFQHPNELLNNKDLKMQTVRTPACVPCGVDSATVPAWAPCCRSGWKSLQPSAISPGWASWGHSCIRMSTRCFCQHREKAPCRVAFLCVGIIYPSAIELWTVGCISLPKPVVGKLWLRNHMQLASVD